MASLASKRKLRLHGPWVYGKTKYYSFAKGS